MATRAVAPRSRASRKADSAQGASTPKRWWEWILVYPALAVALISAGPQWIDKVKGYSLGVASASKAEREAKLWQKNASCLNLNSNGYLSPSNVAVDATICKSGDILVRAVTPQSREVYRWLPLDDVVPAAPQSTASLIPSAHAASLSTRLALPDRVDAKSSYKVALLQMVICTRSDGRYLKRRIQTPQGCVDEVIDTFTGAVVSRNPAPCTPQC